MQSFSTEKILTSMRERQKILKLDTHLDPEFNDIAMM